MRAYIIHVCMWLRYWCQCSQVFYEFHDVSLYRVEEFMLADNLTQPRDKEGWSEGKGTLNMPHRLRHSIYWIYQSHPVMYESLHSLYYRWAEQLKSINGTPFYQLLIGPIGWLRGIAYLVWWVRLIKAILSYAPFYNRIQSLFELIALYPCIGCIFLTILQCSL